MARLRVNFTFSFFTLKWILRSQWSRGLRRGSATANFLGFRVRIPPGHGCLYFVSIVCCQAAVFASDWSLVQRSPIECDREAEIMTSPWHTRGYCATRKKIMTYVVPKPAVCDVIKVRAVHRDQHWRVKIVTCWGMMLGYLLSSEKPALPRFELS